VSTLVDGYHMHMCELMSYITLVDGYHMHIYIYKVMGYFTLVDGYITSTGTIVIWYAYYIDMNSNMNVQFGVSTGIMHSDHNVLIA